MERAFLWRGGCWQERRQVVCSASAGVQKLQLNNPWLDGCVSSCSSQFGGVVSPWFCLSAPLEQNQVCSSQVLAVAGPVGEQRLQGHLHRPLGSGWFHGLSFPGTANLSLGISYVTVLCDVGSFCIRSISSRI